MPECIRTKTATSLLRESRYAEIAEQPPARKALAIAGMLSKLGFNIQFLGGEEYVLDKLQILKGRGYPDKKSFIQNNTPWFMRYFFTYKPCGKQKIFVVKLMKVSLERLAHLIKVCGLLYKLKFTYSELRAP